MIQIAEVTTELGLAQFEIVVCEQCKAQSTVLAAPGWMTVGILGPVDPIESPPANFCCLPCAIAYFQAIIDNVPEPDVLIEPIKKRSRKADSKKE